VTRALGTECGDSGCGGVGDEARRRDRHGEGDLSGTVDHKRRGGDRGEDRHAAAPPGLDQSRRYLRVGVHELAQAEGEAAAADAAAEAIA
jgi:hypothetical protein